MSHEEKIIFLEEHDFRYDNSLSSYKRSFYKKMDRSVIQINNLISKAEVESYQKEGLTLLISHIDNKNQQMVQAEINKTIELPKNIHEVADKNHNVARLFREFKDGHFDYTTFMERILYLLTGAQY